MKNLTLFAIVLLLSAGVAEATPVTLTGQNGQVNIGEYAGMVGPLFDGGYWVDVLGGASLTGFAVSNNFAFQTYVNNSNWPSWWGQVVGPTAWNNGVSIGGGLTTNQLGSFASLFGSDFQALLFYANGGAIITDSNDWDQATDWQVSNIDFGWLNPFIASEFVAFDHRGVVDQSLQVPEPSSVILLLIGFGGLAAYRRRNS